jgi:mRNA-degrading endonuclease toxin of MazEF toxin-antitoxin module
VIVAAFPDVSGGGGKNRPALVVQCDHNNRRLQDTIVAMITGNIRLAATEPTQMLIDPATPDGKSSGLAYPSAVKCENLYTISQGDILRKLESVPPSLMARVDTCLKEALGLPQSVFIQASHAGPSPSTLYDGGAPPGSPPHARAARAGPRTRPGSRLNATICRPAGE